MFIEGFVKEGRSRNFEISFQNAVDGVNTSWQVEQVWNIFFSQEGLRYHECM